MAGSNQEKLRGSLTNLPREGVSVTLGRWSGDKGPRLEVGGGRGNSGWLQCCTQRGHGRWQGYLAGIHLEAAICHGEDTRITRRSWRAHQWRKRRRDDVRAECGLERRTAAPSNWRRGTEIYVRQKRCDYGVWWLRMNNMKLGMTLTGTTRRRIRRIAVWRWVRAFCGLSSLHGGACN
jgi:hypothetical protein